jgi:hypothetical protein
MVRTRRITDRCTGDARERVCHTAEISIQPVLVPSHGVECDNYRWIARSLAQEERHSGGFVTMNDIRLLAQVTEQGGCPPTQTSQ